MRVRHNRAKLRSGRRAQRGFRTVITPPRLRHALLLGASGFAVALALNAGGARAANECGPANAGDTVTCTPAGNSFPDGVSYQVTDLTIVVQDGVIIDTTPGIGGGRAISSGGAGNYGDLTISVGPGTGPQVTITTDDNLATGIYAKTLDGTVSITSDADITTLDSSSHGISGRGFTAVNVTSDGNISTSGFASQGIEAVADGGVVVASTGDIETAGVTAFGIIAHSDNAATKVTSNGDITVTGAGSGGIYASSDASTVSVTSIGDISTSGDANGIRGKSGTAGVTIFSNGNITTLGIGAAGISAQGDGDVTILAGGEISTAGKLADGIVGISTTGDLKITSGSDISTTGKDASGIDGTGGTSATIYAFGDIATTGDDSIGVSAKSSGSSVVLFGGDVSTTGDSAHGLYAGGATLTGVDSTGDIVVVGDGASGIISTSSGDKSIVLSIGNISTKSDGVFGILSNGATSAQAVSQGDITVTGDDSAGIFATGATGKVVVAATGAIQAFGKGSEGIFVSAPSDAALVFVDGDVTGGWDTGRGIFIGASNPSTLNIVDGSVGAMSDLAIVNDTSALTITNDGTITGFLALGAGDDVLDNASPTSWNLRDFADTDGDGQRDTESVAIADFGAGTDTVNNTGTLRLATVDGASAWDTTGQIAHPGGGNAVITQEGVEQGFLVGLEVFNHSGLITLADGVAGDLLVITDQADGATKGANVFTSNGGALALDVVLDDGSSKQSDVLILDKAAVGSGATQILVGNAGGAGGQTTGDGILVVNVRDTSDAAAFALGGTPVAGAYQYELVFQNQAKTDQNWYLQSSFFEGALEYPAIQGGALTTWYSDLGALHERLGERRRDVEDGQSAALPDTATDVADAGAVRLNDSGQGGWLRVVGGDMDIEQSGAADFEVNTARVEAGFDVGVNDILDGEDWLVLGALGGYGWSSVGFESGADIDFNVATIGAYATYFRGPYYLDALVKLDWLDGDYNSEAVSDDGDVELPVFGLSLETGYRFDLSAGGLYLQPQAQLSYAHAGGDSFKDDAGARIKLEDADSLRGRLGARLGQELDSESGAARGNFYLEASVNQEFLGETEARVSGLTLEQDLPETTFEIGGGIDIALPEEGVSFTVDADYTFGDEADGITATGGLRINW